MFLKNLCSDIEIGIANLHGCRHYEVCSQKHHAAITVFMNMYGYPHSFTIYPFTNRRYLDYLYNDGVVEAIKHGRLFQRVGMDNQLLLDRRYWNKFNV